MAKVIELEDGELAFLIEACNAISVRGASARGLVALQEKLARAAATDAIAAEPLKEE